MPPRCGNNSLTWKMPCLKWAVPHMQRAAGPTLTDTMTDLEPELIDVLKLLGWHEL